MNYHGKKQRVAQRALSNPATILADEPTARFNNPQTR